MARTNRILVVEDNATIRRLIETKLLRSGFEVRCADNVIDGIELFTAEAFDLVITDICQPVLSGNLLARYVRNVSANTPIVAVTASPGLANEIFDTVIEKPFALALLLDTVAYYLAAGEDTHGERQLQCCI
jgi:DNA-binding response OmpR family regulator